MDHQADRHGKMLGLNLTRRRLLGGLGLTVGSTMASALLAACGGESAGSTPTTASGGAASTATTGGSTATAAATGGSTPAATGTAPSGEASTGGTITIGISSDATQLDPHKTSSANEIVMFYGIYNRLTRMNENMELVGELATKWEVSQDGKALTVAIHEGVTFHDGTACDAEAVKWNFDRILDPATGSVIKGRIASVESVDVVSPTEVQFNLSRADAVLPTNLGYGSMAMVSKAAVEKFGEDFAANPVGTGPFKFVEWLRDDHVTLERFADYWDSGRPKVDQIIFKPIPDGTVRLTALRTGQIDVNFVVEPKDVQPIESNPDLVLWSKPNPGHMGIRLNVNKEPFTDKRVRQAVAWAVDRDAVNKIVFFGQYTPIYGPYDPMTWAFDPDFKPYQPRDLEKAKALLAEAGYADGIEFKLIYSSNPQTAQLAELLQAQLAEANIHAVPEAVERGVFLDGIVSREWVSYIDGVAGREDPNNYFAEHFVCGMQYNGQDYCNEEMDALIAQAAAIYDQDERRPLYRQIEEMISEDSPMVFIYATANARAWHKKIQDLSFNPLGRMFYWDAWIQE